MRANTLQAAVIAAAVVLVLSSCAKKTAEPAAAAAGTKSIVATYSILQSLVKDLVGDAFTVSGEIPNGLDPHEWEPSAKDIETLNKAALVVENGLGLEGGMEKTLAAARGAGVPFFTASDHIQIRKVGVGEGIPSGDSDQAAGAEDPHLWMDPVSVKQVMDALATRLKDQFGTDLSKRQADLDARLDALDRDVHTLVDSLPQASRRLVTGHESLGYFAQRYGFTLVGAIIPSLSTQADVSASQMAALKKIIQRAPVKAVFTELGTPKSVVDTLAKELKVKSVELTTHSLPPDGSYFTFMRDVARLVSDSLR